MWSTRGGPRSVTCIACGATVARDQAREYDKHGDRWDREGKSFEHLCKPCDALVDRYPRGDLEETLVELEAGRVDRDAFLARYHARLTSPDSSRGDRRK